MNQSPKTNFGLSIVQHLFGTLNSWARRAKPSHLQTFTPSHLRTFTPSHLRTFTPSHLRTFTPSHLRTFTPSHLRTFTPSHLRTFTPSHLQTRHYTLIEMLAWTAVGVLMLNGIILMSSRMSAYHRQQLTAAWNLQEETVIATRWRSFAEAVPNQGIQITNGRCVIGDRVATADDGQLVLDGKATPLPEDIQVQFLLEAELLILQLTDPTTNESIRIVARTPTGGTK